MQTPALNFSPATFIQRYVAWTLDATLLAAVTVAVCWAWIVPAAVRIRDHTQAMLATLVENMVYAFLSDVPPERIVPYIIAESDLAASMTALTHALWNFAWPLLVGFVTFSTIYHVLFECGKQQATPGQRSLHLRVETVEGERLSIGSAMLRHFSGALSWLTLNIGHLMALSKPMHQTLHDSLSKTRVVQTTASAQKLPAWAWVWISMQLLAFAVTLIWINHSMNTWVNQMLEGMLALQPRS